MSNYQTRDNSGSPFKNEDKKSDKHPDYSGSCVIEGADFFFDAWIKTAESGRRYMSFSFKRKEKQSATQPQRQAPRTHGDRPGGPKNRPAPPPSGFDDDSDIPF